MVSESAFTAFANLTLRLFTERGNIFDLKYKAYRSYLGDRLINVDIFQALSDTVCDVMGGKQTRVTSGRCRRVWMYLSYGIIYKILCVFMNVNLYHCSIAGYKR